MLASGLRLGEAWALLWQSVDFDARTLEVESTVVRLNGQGLLRKSTKTTAGRQALRLPSWCVEKLRVCATAGFRASETPVFPARMGALRER